MLFMAEWMLLACLKLSACRSCFIGSVNRLSRYSGRPCSPVDDVCHASAAAPVLLQSVIVAYSIIRRG